MWTGRKITLLVVILGALVLVACQLKSESTDGQGQDMPISAWWYSVDFEPTSAAVRGIDVHTIDKGWQRATALDTTLLDGRTSQNDIQQFKASPLSFSLLADLDGDGAAEEFFVGVFETVAGEKGRFVAITRHGRAVEHFEERGITGFSALLQGEGEIRWYKCMECGEFESIKWSGKSYALE